MYSINLFAEVKQAAGYLSSVQLAIVLTAKRKKLEHTVPDRKHTYFLTAERMLVTYYHSAHSWVYAQLSMGTNDRDDDDPWIILVSMYNFQNLTRLLMKKITGFWSNWKQVITVIPNHGCLCPRVLLQLLKRTWEDC